jgi:hypothetical protein
VVESTCPEFKPQYRKKKKKQPFSEKKLEAGRQWLSTIILAT